MIVVVDAFLGVWNVCMCVREKERETDFFGGRGGKKRTRLAQVDLRLDINDWRSKLTDNERVGKICQLSSLRRTL